MLGSTTLSLEEFCRIAAPLTSGYLPTSAGGYGYGAGEQRAAVATRGQPQQPTFASRPLQLAPHHAHQDHHHELRYQQGQPLNVLPQPQPQPAASAYAVKPQMQQPLYQPVLPTAAASPQQQLPYYNDDVDFGPQGATIAEFAQPDDQPYARQHGTAADYRYVQPYPQPSTAAGVTSGISSLNPPPTVHFSLNNNYGRHVHFPPPPSSSSLSPPPTALLREDRWRQLLGDISHAVYHRSGPVIGGITTSSSSATTGGSSASGARDAWRAMAGAAEFAPMSPARGVGAEDLRVGLGRLGVQLAPAEAQAVVRAFDANKDGQLDLTEWLHLLQAAKHA